MKIEIATEPLVAGTVTMVSVISIAATAILATPEARSTATAAIITISTLAYATVVFIRRSR